MRLLDWKGAEKFATASNKTKKSVKAAFELQLIDTDDWELRDCRNGKAKRMKHELYVHTHEPWVGEGKCQFILMMGIKYQFSFSKWRSLSSFFSIFLCRHCFVKVKIEMKSIKAYVECCRQDSGVELCRKWPLGRRESIKEKWSFPWRLNFAFRTKWREKGDYFPGHQV